MNGMPGGIRSSRGSMASRAGAAAGWVMGSGAQATTKAAGPGALRVTSPRPPSMPDDRDAAQLARLGYAQELLRRLGAFSSFAIGFSVISVLTGVTSTFGDALGAGGPAGLGPGGPPVAGGAARPPPRQA